MAKTDSAPAHGSPLRHSSSHANARRESKESARRESNTSSNYSASSPAIIHETEHEYLHGEEVERERRDGLGGLRTPTPEVIVIDEELVEVCLSRMLLLLFLVCAFGIGL